MFAVIGAIGCLLGAIMGEGFVRAPRQQNREILATSTELCLLMDHSGSMAGGKLEEVVRSASSFVHRQNLQRNPIGVAAFSTTAQPLVELTSSRDEIDRALAQLRPEGATCMDLGLESAKRLLQHVPANQPSAPRQAILLFTDGEPDDGGQNDFMSGDIAERTRRAAQSIRESGTRIVAVGTGDAKTAYLAQLTGDPSLVFFASQGGFDAAFRQAEKVIYRRQLVDSGGKSYSLTATLVRNVGWSVLISLGLAFLLWGGQNTYLHRAPYAKGDSLSLLQGGAVAGISAGLTAQFGLSLFSQVEGSDPLLQRGAFVLAWTLLGALMGRGISKVVPNLKWQTALGAGAIGGLVAGTAFLVTSAVSSDLAARFIGAIILGCAIGYSIALAEEIVRTASLIVRWGPRETSTINLGPKPITIGGGDDHVFLRGLHPKAYSVWMEGAKVFCKDEKKGKNVELVDKSTFTVARVEFQVALTEAPPPR
jgi:Ca-activated chloride channel family protein